MGQTSIQWTDHSVNPIKFKLRMAAKPVNLCTVCSTGCENCYSANNTRRFWPKEAGPFPGYTAQALKLGEFIIDESKLQEVLRRRKPTKYFWCDMTDMFHPSVPFELVDRCFAVMALTPRHTHQILTKRPERMAEYLSTDDRVGKIQDVIIFGMDSGTKKWSGWALPNVWLGTSVEDQKRADERIPHLLQCPAAVRFLSCEPLLGPVDLDEVEITAAPGFFGSPLRWHHRGKCHEEEGIPYPTVSWVIVGGESGPGARDSYLEWHLNIIRQCAAAGVPVFEKQIGSKPRTSSVDIANTWPVPLYIDGDWIPIKLKDSKGGDPFEWPEDLRVRQMPQQPATTMK